MTEPLPAAALAVPRRAEHADDIDEVAHFVEQMGLICEREQMPRIAGRLIGLFLVEGGPLSLAALADRLKVSRASVSTNTRMLAEIGLLERVGVPGDRRDYYRLVEAPFEQILTAMVQRMTTLGNFLSNSAARFPADRAEASERLRSHASVHFAMAESMRDVLRRLETKTKP